MVWLKRPFLHLRDAVLVHRVVSDVVEATSFDARRAPWRAPAASSPQLAFASSLVDLAAAKDKSNEAALLGRSPSWPGLALRGLPTWLMTSAPFRLGLPASPCGSACPAIGPAWIG